MDLRPIDFDYTRPGKERRVYRQWLVEHTPRHSILLTHPYQDRSVDIANRRVMETGGSLVWFIVPGRWYDIGAFFLPDATFTGWYTNLLTPVAMDGSTWSAVDLFLDHWVGSDGTEIWLDRGEYEEAVRRGLVTEVQQRQVEEVVRRIDSSPAWPPIANVPNIKMLRTTLGSR